MSYKMAIVLKNGQSSAPFSPITSIKEWKRKYNYVKPLVCHFFSLILL